MSTMECEFSHENIRTKAHSIAIARLSASVVSRIDLLRWCIAIAILASVVQTYPSHLSGRSRARADILSDRKETHTPIVNISTSSL